jgi:hypothetical protein
MPRHFFLLPGGVLGGCGKLRSYCHCSLPLSLSTVTYGSSLHWQNQRLWERPQGNLLTVLRLVLGRGQALSPRIWIGLMTEMLNLVDGLHRIELAPLYVMCSSLCEPSVPFLLIACVGVAATCSYILVATMPSSSVRRSTC